MAIIGKKEVEHLAELARIDLTSEMLNVKSKMDANQTGEMGNVKSGMDEREKIAGDLEKILKHFEELKEADTDAVKPMTGGTSEENVFRADGAMSEMLNVKSKMDARDKIVKQFPESKDGFLKVPAVFNDENLESRK